MPRPHEVYSVPSEHWDYLTAQRDEDFEGQHFDRKEAGRSVSIHLRSIRDFIRETVSAFANSNREGGLLVVGIASDGSVKGLSHLNEQQRNSILDLNSELVHHGCQAKLCPCTNDRGQQDSIALFHVTYASTGICETHEGFPRAWKRQGIQNFPLTADDRARLGREKTLTLFERARAEGYDPSILDGGILQEFRTSYLKDASLQHNDEALLYNAGAVIRDSITGALTLSNAGVLFFLTNPQRVFPAARLRLLRFDCLIQDRQIRPLPDFDREFTGPVTKQIRDFRTFLHESGFLKTYQRRNSAGGFLDEPELPFNVIDEAVVNAVAHRDYAIELPILCEKYADALLVISPGEIRQHIDLPEHFTLDTVSLDHLPRNPLLMDWLGTVRDTHGAAFVRALREGTRQMREAMASLGLPAPEYTSAAGRTEVILTSNAPEREAELRAAAQGPVETEQFTNLYPLTFAKGRLTDALRKDTILALKNKLEASGWFTDRLAYGVLTAHMRGVSIPLPAAAGVVALYPAYSFQVREYFHRAYLCVDYTVTVQSLLTLVQLHGIMEPADFVGLSCVVNVRGWLRGRITEVEGEWAVVRLYDYDEVEKVVASRVIPHLPKKWIDHVLTISGVSLDLNREIKKASLGLQSHAARSRASRIQSTVDDIATNVFPILVGTDTLSCATKPLALARSGTTGLRYEVLAEPEVEVGHKRTTPDIRDGITRHGAYDDERRDIEVIPVTSPALRDKMTSLIDRLRNGKFKYHGSERTFSTRLTYRSIVTINPAEALSECKRLIAQYPEWAGDSELNRVFLVHSPEQGHSLDDENSPYYRVKRLLFEAGIPCQMVDTPTILNPDYKDLNLALNIVAKTGGVPWVLPESIPDADFLVGLSYTESRKADRQRIIGFANVFNQYGRWEFYSATADAFSWDDRAANYEGLVAKTLSRLQLSETPSVYFHYSAKFSREDREAIVRGARGVRPLGKYTFVWINSHHQVRLFDSRAETDGSLSRGSYVIGSGNQLYLSTTGFNPYRKPMGTPQALEVNVRVEPKPGATASADLRAIAAQLLSLTKLNWASTDALCGEPITTKYAGDVAYLTAAFLRQGGEFRLHPVLEKTPWFI